MTAAALEGIDQLVIGGYTAEMEGEAAGLLVLEPAPEGHSERVQILEASSPSYVLAHPDRPLIFTAGEGATATASSYRLSNGRLEPVSTLPTGGQFACHLALSQDGNHLLVANYGSGSVSCFAVAEDGTLRGPLDVLGFAGSGADPERQEGPHAHQVLPLDGELAVCDLGTDRIHRLHLTADGLFARAADPVHLPAGCGPRHAVLVPGTTAKGDGGDQAEADRLVVACELSSELWVARRDGDSWVETQRLPTTRTTTGPRQPSGIVSDGRTVTVATRGPDTITTFAVEDGVLRPLAEVPCGGTWPRALTLSGDRLWVANQHDGSVSVLDLSRPETPRLEGRLAAPSATCVVLLPLRPAR